MIELDGRIIRIVTGLSGVTYNSQLAPMQPTLLDDFLKPAWKGKIASTPYAAGLDVLVAQDVWGKDRTVNYVRALARQITGVIRCGEAERVATGEYLALVMDCTGQDALLWQERGAPLAQMMPLDAAQQRYYYFAVPKNAQHPNAAKLYTIFTLTEEGQKLAFETWKTDLHFMPGSRMSAVVADYQKRNVKFREVTVDWWSEHPEIDATRSELIKNPDHQGMISILHMVSSPHVMAGHSPRRGRLVPAMSIIRQGSACMSGMAGTQGADARLDNFPAMTTCFPAMPSLKHQLLRDRSFGDLMPAIMLSVVLIASVVILAHLAVVLWLSWTDGSPGDPDLGYTAQNFVEVFSDFAHLQRAARHHRFRAGVARGGARLRRAGGLARGAHRFPRQDAAVHPDGRGAADPRFRGGDGLAVPAASEDRAAQPVPGQHAASRAAQHRHHRRHGLGAGAQSGAARLHHDGRRVPLHGSGARGSRADARRRRS